MLMALLAFAQANVAFADCPMDRGSLAPMVQIGEPCGGCDTEFKPYFPEHANRCVAHCTADLQNVGPDVALVRSPGPAPMFLVEAFSGASIASRGLIGPPPGAPPRRIVLHSFLI